MAEQPRYPDISVELGGQDQDAQAIIAAVIVALREHGVDNAEVQAFRREAIADDRDHLLRTCMAWVNVTGRRPTRPAP